MDEQEKFKFFIRNLRTKKDAKIISRYQSNYVAFIERKKSKGSNFRQEEDNNNKRGNSGG